MYVNRTKYKGADKAIGRSNGEKDPSPSISMPRAAKSDCLDFLVVLLLSHIFVLVVVGIAYVLLQCSVHNAVIEMKNDRGFLRLIGHWEDDKPHQRRFVL